MCSSAEAVASVQQGLGVLNASPPMPEDLEPGSSQLQILSPIEWFSLETISQITESKS